MRRWFSFCAVIGSLLTLPAACVTSAPEAGYGIQPEHASYVPARIAILPCRPWPTGARFAALPLSNAKDQEIQALCQSLDTYVLSGFNGQPFMKGYSPKFVQKALADANQSGILDGLAKLWAHQAGDCQSCANPAGFYAASIAKRPEWLAWLNSLSQGARSADAVLLPFVTYAYDKRYDDRGLQVAERGAGVTLLLVDTNNGSLLWAGGREAVVPAKRLTGGNVAGPLAPPPWSEAEERLATEALWRDFPGRQIF